MTKSTSSTILLIIIGVLFGTVETWATDLLVKRAVFPGGPLRALTQTQVGVEIRNDNILAANEYTITVSIVNRASNQTVYTSEIVGTPIQPFTDLTLLASQMWMPLVSGLYDIRMQIFFADEINPGNNTKTETFTVSAVARLATLYRQFWLSPFMVNHNAITTLKYRVPPAQIWQYLNVRATTGDDTSWVIRNQPLPPNTDTTTYTQTVNLSSVYSDADPPDSVELAIDYGSLPLSVDLGLKTFLKYELDTLTYWRGGVQDTSEAPTISISQTPPTTTSTTTVRDSMVWGCRIPNIDLDSASYPPQTPAGYAGDINACVPAATANSMQWLESMHPQIRTGLSHRQKLYELSEMMRREDGRGVWAEDLIRAKLEYINKYDLPIKVKFQLRGQSTNIESMDDYESSAENRGTGGHPTWDFLKQEVKDTEDVEMLVEYHKDTGTGSFLEGRHAVCITGVAESGGKHRAWYKDDGNQSGPGGTEQSPVEWDTLPGGIPAIEVYKVGNRAYASVPFCVVSESYDPTVRRKEKGRARRWFNGAWEWVFGRRGGDEDPVENDSIPVIRFVNVFREGGSRQHWPVRNVPVGGVFGEHVTVPSTPSTTPTTPSRFTYADTTTLSPSPTVTYPWSYPLQGIDSTLGGATTLGTEPWRPSVGELDWPMFSGKGLTITDSTLIWTRGLSYDLKLGYGLSGPASLTYALDRMATHDSVNLPDTDEARFEELRTRVSATPNGTDRVSVVRGLLDYIDAHRLPIRPRFQSASIDDTTIFSPNTTWNHGARNETDSSGPDLQWLRSALMYSPVIVELGTYDASGRTSGTWVTVAGIMRQNGVQRLVLHTDADEGGEGGRRTMIVSVVPDNGAQAILEMSTESSRTIVESAIALRKDPTIVFTSVSEDASREIADVVLTPIPASTAITIAANIVRSPAAQISLVNIVGNEVWSASIPSDALRSGVSIDVSEYAPGTYTVLIRTQLGVQSVRCVVTK